MKSSNPHLSVALYPCDELVTMVFNITSMLQQVDSFVSTAYQSRCQKLSTPLESERTHGPAYISVGRNVRRAPY